MNYLDFLESKRQLVKPAGFQLEAYDRKMIAACSEMVVLRLDGWEESTGVQAEIVIAQELGLPVHFVHPREEVPSAAE